MRFIALLVLFASCDAGAPPRSPGPTSPTPPTSTSPTVATPPAGPTPPAPPPKVAARMCTTSREIDATQVAEPQGTAKVDAQSILPDRDCKAFETSGYGADEQQRAEKLPTGFDVVASRADYQKKFHCKAPAAIDFAKSRVAILRYNHQTPDFVGFDHAVESNGKIVAIMSESHACQGIAPALEHSVIAFTLPSSAEPVEVVYCEGPSEPCGAVP